MSSPTSVTSPKIPGVIQLGLPLTMLLVVLGGIFLGLPEEDPASKGQVDAFPALAAGEEAILFGGDVLWARDYRKFTRKEGLDYPARGILPLIRSAKARAFVANHEGPITKRGRRCPPARRWNYRSRIRNLKVLPEIGFTHLSLANNHALDRCVKGLTDTTRHLRKKGIEPFGAGADIGEARKPVVIDVGNTRVAVSGGMEAWSQYRDADWGATEQRGGVAFLDKGGIPALIQAGQAEADFVVAFPHWGKNYQPISGKQRRIAKRLVEAGADAILGHHGHAAQGFGYLDGVPVIWGLGNLFFGTPGRFGHDKLQPGYGLLVRMVVAQGRVDRFEIAPVMVNNRLVDFQPRVCTVEESERVLRSLAARGGSKIELVRGIAVLPARID